MPGEAPRTRRALALAKTVAKFAAAWGAFIAVANNDLLVNRVTDALGSATQKALANFPLVARYTENLYQDVTFIFLMTAFVTLVFGTGLAVLGGATRMVARARVRAGHADFLDRLRGWTAAHPKVTRALLAAPALAWMLRLGWPSSIAGSIIDGPILDTAPGPYVRILPALLVAGWGLFAMTKKGVRELLAPTLGGDEATARFEIGPEEIGFDAVAVTRETLATVGLYSAITLGLPAFGLLYLLMNRGSVHDGSSLGFIAYLAFVGFGAFAFRRASRVAIGVDGVHIRGTSRARFFAYRDLDSARVKGGDVELVRRGKVVLRLQLHGEDAARRDAVLARITESIARVREGRGAVAAQIVASSSKDALARVAEGGGDYRMATLTREQLWALVEGPEIEASARKAAAEALVRSSDDGERARLRVAAEHCAEPQVRIALQEIADEEHVPEGRTPMDAPPVAIRAGK
jgi:hypothetical protein